MGKYITCDRITYRNIKTHPNNQFIIREIIMKGYKRFSI